MNEFIKKLIERLEEKKKNIAETQRRNMYKLGFNVACAIVNQVAEEYGDGWIPCSDRLPEEPAYGLHDLNSFPEYNVMIENAKIPTTLHYTGDGAFYKVIAWQPLPDPFIPIKKQEETCQRRY